MRGSSGRTSSSSPALVLVPPLSSSASKRSPVWRRRRLRGRSTSSRLVLLVPGSVALVRLFDPEQPIALLLPMIPAGIAALAYMRWRPFRSFLFISLACHCSVVGILTSVPLAVDDRQGIDVEVRSRTPVVLVVFDNFRELVSAADGSLDGVRYPNFARFARERVWYPRATTVHASTTQAVPAILTGLHPRQGQLPTLTDHPTNLFTLLGERYSIRAAEQATRLCPVRYCPGHEFSCVPGPRAWPPLDTYAHTSIECSQASSGPAAAHRSAVWWFWQCAR